MNTIGLDLSLTATGIVVWDADENRLVYSKLIQTKKDEYSSDAARFWYITKQIMQVITEHGPGHIAIEGPAFQGREKRIYELAGVVKVVLHRHGYAYILVQPNTLKKWATGYGRASKDDMVEYARHHAPEVTDHNIADALHLARYVAESVS